MKKAGTCPAFVSNRSGLLLVHLVRLGLLVGGLLAGLLAGLLRVLLVHLARLGFRFLVRLLLLRERGEARGRKDRRNEDCYELLHRHPLLWLYKERPALGAVRSE